MVCWLTAVFILCQHCSSGFISNRLCRLTVSKIKGKGKGKRKGESQSKDKDKDNSKDKQG